MSTCFGRVASLHCYPVKSLDGPDVEQVEVLPTGLAHDRGWAVTAGDEVLTARGEPVLREIRAAPPRTAGDAPSLLLPGTDYEVSGMPADKALSRLLGRDVVVRPAAAGEGFTEVAPVHLVSRQAVERAAAGDGAQLGDPACGVEQPRANVVLDLDGDQLETAWVGRDVHLGGVVLRVSKQPKHCLGVYADVVRPGAVSVGDEVRLG